MLIQPVSPMRVYVKVEQEHFDCQLVSLSDTKLELHSHSYLKESHQVLFFARYFRGRARLEHTEYTGRVFKYTLSILSIQFQPGLLVNMRL